MDESLEKWILSLRQEDISGILWACQSSTERCVSKAIFVSLRPTVEAGQRDPRSIAGRTIINVRESPACDQQLIELAFLGRSVIDKANRWDCKARDNYVSAGFFKFVSSVGDKRNGFTLRSAWSRPATGRWLMSMPPHFPLTSTTFRVIELLIMSMNNSCCRNMLTRFTPFNLFKALNQIDAGSFFSFPFFLVEIAFVCTRLTHFFESLETVDELFPCRPPALINRFTTRGP